MHAKASFIYHVPYKVVMYVFMNSQISFNPAENTNSYTHLWCPSDLGLGGDFRRVLRFPLPVTTGQSWLSRNMAEKVTKNEIPNSKFNTARGECNP